MNPPRLSPGMLARYEIEDRRPPRINAVQFGLSPALLGAVDRRIDDAAAIGIACVAGGDLARRLREQEGLYTLVIRGYAGDEAVRREQVVQCLREIVPPEDVEALAQNPDIALAIVDADDDARALAGRFARARAEAGLPEVPALALGDNLLSDSLAFRAEADEAARLCREMNYLDEMLHLAEPAARLTVRAEGAPLGSAPGIEYVDAAGMALARALKGRVFDAGLALMAATGWLNGCDTLRDCMRHPRLRKFVGEAFTEELLPMLDDLPRAAVEARVIESFGRYEDPLNRNRLLAAAPDPLQWFIAEGVPLMRRWADENFEPPRRLAFALAATIMLLAGARLNAETGRYEVARGSHTEALDADPDRLAVFSALSHDMPPDTLAYAVLADRELWQGADLRDIDGLEARVTLDLAAMQREPGFLPE